MEKYTIPLTKIGVKPGDAVGNINLDAALATYMATHSVDPGDAPGRPAPVGECFTMRERILAMSLSPDPLRLSKIKRIFK